MQLQYPKKSSQEAPEPHLHSLDLFHSFKYFSYIDQDISENISIFQSRFHMI